jgi:ornithine cyclodeaminase
MQTISAAAVNRALAYPKLINALQKAFTENITVPPRLHFDIENPKASRETTLLMMPAWQAGDVAGIKLVTVAPDNHLYQLPSIQGTYLLFDIKTGTLKASIDAPSLTAKRTAAASALAARFLLREDSQVLLIVGTGTLAPQLIAAHASVRPIKTVYVWGRSLVKAQLVCQQIKHLNLHCEAIENLKEYVTKADIISCATLSTEPLIFG